MRLLMGTMHLLREGFLVRKLYLISRQLFLLFQTTIATSLQKDPRREKLLGRVHTVLS